MDADATEVLQETITPVYGSLFCSSYAAVVAATTADLVSAVIIAALSSCFFSSVAADAATLSVPVSDVDVNLPKLNRLP